MDGRAVRWIDVAHSADDRGTLTVLEVPTLPFEVKRLFYMHRVPPDQERGGHAHRDTRQCAIAVAGSFVIDATHGSKTESFVLDDPNRALYLPAMTWVRLHGFQPATVALVLCDTVYDPEKVIRTVDEFRDALRTGPLRT